MVVTRVHGTSIRHSRIGVVEVPGHFPDGSMAALGGLMARRSSGTGSVFERSANSYGRRARTAPTRMSVNPPEAWEKAARTYMRALVDAVRQAAA